MFRQPQPNPVRRPGRAGPWLAVLLGMLLIVSSVAYSAAWGRRLRGQRRMAEQDLGTLIRAGERFFREYGIWPTPHSGQYGDFRYGRDFPNSFVLNILRAVSGDGNPGHSVNTRRIVLMDARAASAGMSGISAEGNLMDPWGGQYQVVLDTDLDNSCHVESSVYGTLPGYGMVAWSCGPDGISDTGDDICSWLK